MLLDPVQSNLPVNVFLTSLTLSVSYACRCGAGGNQKWSSFSSGPFMCGMLFPLKLIWHPHQSLLGCRPKHFFLPMHVTRRLIFLSGFTVCFSLEFLLFGIQNNPHVFLLLSSYVCLYFVDLLVIVVNLKDFRACWISFFFYFMSHFKRVKWSTNK